MIFKAETAARCRAAERGRVLRRVAVRRREEEFRFLSARLFAFRAEV